MNAERLISRKTNGSMAFVAGWADLPPTQAGLAAALRRAFEMPVDETTRQFEELLRRLN